MSRCLAFLLTLLLPFCAAFAQIKPILKSERLSDWLLSHTSDSTYLQALSWQVPQEKVKQQALKVSLLEALERSLTPSASQLMSWVKAQKITGRVILPSTDARWLQVHIELDPVLRSDQVIAIYSRPTSVRVLLSDGRVCHVPHQAALTAAAYISACNASAGDLAWIAQPDGRVTKVGIAAWNAQPQNELAPGAWIWAPNPDDGYTSGLSEGLIRFVATLDLPPDESVKAQDMGVQSPYALQAVPQSMLRSQPLSASDWGEIGLLQTPTARMQNAGAFRAHISKVQPYTRTNIMFQPLDWLEAGFRYTDISNQLYDTSGALQTTQTYKDKSLDVKLRLRDESSFWPALALGIRDIGGTGFFSSEYLVAGKRFGDFDFSAGIGWGNMGSAANIKNPLTVFGSTYAVRPSTATVSGGEVGGKAFFKGNAAVFGGVQWRASDQWLLKLEREGNNYQRENLNQGLSFASPWNVGATYRYSAVTDFSVGFERGNKLMLGVTFNADLDGLQVPKLLNAPITKYVAAPLTAPSQLHQALGTAVFDQTGWTLVLLDESASVWRLRLDMGGGSGSNSHRLERAERIYALLQSMSPLSVTRWELSFVERGIKVHAIEVDRAAWQQSQTELTPLSLRRETSLAFAPPVTDIALSASAALPSKPATTVRLGPSFSQILGGPDAFLLYRIGAEISATHQFDPSTWIDGSVDVRLADNMSGFKYTAPSDLPRVRTNLREYTTTSRVTMPVLQATHVNTIAPNHFGSVYGGYLESMFAGVGAEWLYRPWHSRLAFGVDVNFVRQRGFEQNFGLRDYQVSTGHAAVYWDTGFADTLVKLQAGKYLAGDIGATLDVSRRFNNGTAMGVYATKTNVSAQQFGEGSFDKGLYFSMPFDVMLPKYTDRTATIRWQPLTRDGGARLQRQQQLYNITAGRDPRAFEYISSDPATQVKTSQLQELAAFQTPDALSKAAEDAPSIIHAIKESAQTAALTAAQTTRELVHPDSLKSWAWGLGLVAVSSALDEKANRWALGNAGSNHLAKLGNTVPLVLGLAAFADLGDHGMGWTALQSAGFAFAANSALRVAFGRARPEEARGSHAFDPLTAKGLKSSFPSNHTAVAFALATTFAQTYDMPWLYAAAGLAGLGRVQSGQHWLSDTVAGGVLGYAIGSVMADQHKQNSSHSASGRQLLVVPSGIAAKWWWQ